MSEYISTIRGFNREVRLFLVTSVLMGFCVFGGIYSVILNLYLLRLGYGTEYIGLVNAVGFLSTAVFAMFGVSVTNRLGIRRGMILGMTLAAIGYLGVPLGEGMAHPGPALWILALYTLANFGLTIYLVGANPFLMAVTTPAERSHAFSMQVALWPLAGFAGSLVGGSLPAFFVWTLGASLDDPAPYRYPLLVAAVMLSPAILALWNLQDVSTTRPSPAPVSHATINPAAINPTTNKPTTAKLLGATPRTILLMMGLVGFLRVIGEGVGRTFFNVYLDDALGVSTVQIGALLAVAQLVAAPLALTAPLLVTRFGNQKLLTWGTVGMALAMLPLALLPHWLGAGIGLMALLALTSMIRPAFMIYSQEVVHPEWRVAMSGITTFSVGLSWALIAFGGGYLIAGAGYQALFLLAALLTSLGAVAFAFFARKVTPIVASKPEAGDA